MKRHHLILSALVAVLVAMPMNSAEAAGGMSKGHGCSVGKGHGHGRSGGLRASHGHKHGRKFGHGRSVSHGRGFGHGLGFGFGGFFVDDHGLADLYRELYDNIPYFALHPPVYYSYPVPRTYGYSPFAYPPYVMTPDAAPAAQPLTVINPYVPNSEKAKIEAKQDRTAATSAQPEPLVIVNPFVAPNRSVASVR